MPRSPSHWSDIPQADERSTRRLRITRWFVLICVALHAVFILVMALVQVELAFTSPEEVQWGPLSWSGMTLPWYAALLLVLAGAVAVLTVLLVRCRINGRRSCPPALLYWSLGVLLALVSVMDVTLFSVAIVATWWSAAILVIPRRTAVLLSTAVVGFLISYTLVLSSQPPVVALAFIILTLPMALLNAAASFSVVWLWEVAREATLAREARARLAVSEERLRFARDMHDLLGHSLSGIAVKSELAARLARSDPERAAAEMAEVQRIAREALREVRAAVSGYRAVNLADELASVRSVLLAAGVSATVTGNPADIPAQSQSLIAWLVREGATNVLRHSSAQRCDITLSRQDRTWVVEVYNDGVRAGKATRFGNGLTGLSERVASAGGTLTASHTCNGGFLLRAVLPVPASVEEPVRETQEKKAVA